MSCSGVLAKLPCVKKRAQHLLNFLPLQHGHEDGKFIAKTTKGKPSLVLI